MSKEVIKIGGDLAGHCPACHHHPLHCPHHSVVVPVSLVIGTCPSLWWWCCYWLIKQRAMIYLGPLITFRVMEVVTPCDINHLIASSTVPLKNQIYLFTLSE